MKKVEIYPKTVENTVGKGEIAPYKPFESTVGKGEIAHNEQFLLFPQCFLPVWINLLPFSSKVKLSSANSFSLEESKICRLVIG